MNLNAQTLLSTLSTPAPHAQDDVTTWLEQNRPALEEKARAVFAPPFYPGEVYDLIGAVVTAAGSGLTVLPGQDRKAVVKAVVNYLFTTFAAGKLPFALRFILTPTVLDGVIESIYQMLFKAQPALAPVAPTLSTASIPTAAVTDPIDLSKWQKGTPEGQPTTASDFPTEK